MKVLIGIASSLTQHVGSLRTCYRLRSREGDAFADEWRYRGDVTRESFVDELLSNDTWEDDDALLFLDADQRHPEDMLEKLREHNLDMVCAHYYRRETDPIQSLCYELGDGTWPFLPFIHPPKEGMHEIAVTGFGCVLIKKKVFKAVQAILPKGMSPVAIGPIPEIANDHMNWGPDFRFFHFARKLGFKLWLDASIQSLHAVTLWLGHQSAEKLIDYTDWADAAQLAIKQRLEIYGVSLEAFKQRKRVLETRREGLMQQAEDIQKLRAKTTNPEEMPKIMKALTEVSIAIYQMDGKIQECETWIEWEEKYPRIERPDQLPTTENTPKQETINDEASDFEGVKDSRLETYKQNAVELAEMLPDVGDAKPGNG